MGVAVCRRLTGLTSLIGVRSNGMGSIRNPHIRLCSSLAQVRSWAPATCSSARQSVGLRQNLAGRTALSLPLSLGARNYSTDLPEHIVVEMPALSPTMTHGTIVSWNVAIGGEVTAGDSLGEIETDKATMSFDSTEDGYVAKHLVEPGTSDIALGTPVMIICEEEADVPTFADYTPSADAASEPTVAAPTASPTPVPVTVAPTLTAAPAAQPSASGVAAKTLSPAVLALVLRHDLDASRIPATGPKGHILKGDVLAFLDGDVAVAPAPAQAAAKPKPAAAPAPRDTGSSFTDTPTTNIRKVIASRLTESKTTIPHAYSTVEVDMTNVMALRKQLIEATGTKFSLNDVIIKASALSLRMVPEVNAQIGADGEVVQLPTVDVSVAVATPTGLITPIVTGADGRGVGNISETIKELAGRAREGKLLPHEFQGGTFSVSNLGMFGINSFSAVINPPQSCILAVGGTTPKVLVGDDGEHDIRSIGSFTLSSDARVADDEVAARFLVAFKKFMENPQAML